MISALILAAGMSKRFRNNKLITPIMGKPMIKWTVEAAVNSMVDEVIVILGFEAEKVRKVIDDLPCKIIVNENYLDGMSSTVKFGVKYVMNYSEAVVIIPGDCPFIGSNSINLVINAYRETRAPIIIATFKGRRGHPILISHELFPEVLKISEETYGLKQLIRKYEDKILHVEASTIGVLIDIDSPDDIDRAVKLILKRK